MSSPPSRRSIGPNQPGPDVVGSGSDVQKVGSAAAISKVESDRAAIPAAESTTHSIPAVESATVPIQKPTDEVPLTVESVAIPAPIVDSTFSPISAPQKTRGARRARHAKVTRPSMVRSTLITVGGAAVLPLTALVTGPLLARVLGPYDRGLMSAVLAPIFVAMFVAAFAVPEATTYVVSRLNVPVRRAAFVGSQILLLSGVLAATGLYFAAPIIERGTPEAIGLLRQALPWLPLLMFALMQRFAMNGHRDYRAVALERTTAAVGRLIVLVVLAIVGSLTAQTAIWTNIGSTLFAGLILLVPMMRTRLEPAREAALAGWMLTRRMLGYSIRGWGGVFANLVSWRFDQAILPAFVGAAQLGFYAVAVSFAELPSALISATKGVVFSEASARDDLRIVARAARVVLAISILVDGVLIATAPLLVRFLFGEPFAPAAELAQILLFGNIPFAAEVIIAAGLLSAGRPGLRSVGQTVSAIVTLVGIFVLVPLIGTTGAAYTSVSAYMISYLLTLLFFRRVSGIRIRDCVFLKRSDVVWAGRLLTSRLRKRGRGGGETPPAPVGIK